MSTLANNLYQTAQIRELESLAIKKLKISETALMERAGAAAFQCLLQYWPKTKTISVVCGSGNNGGDGYVVARLAQKQGISTQVFQLGTVASLKGAAKKAAEQAKKAGVKCTVFKKTAKLTADVIVDAILGIGINGELRASASEAIAAVNKTRKPVLAIDLPSGLQADTGIVATKAVRAAVTITFIGVKLGLVQCDGPRYCGELIWDDLAIPADVFKQIAPIANCLNDQKLFPLLPERAYNAHKGDFGHVLAIGGNYGMAGAVRMAAESAARVGAGLTSIWTRPEHAFTINSVRPEIMCYGTQIRPLVQELLQKATVVVVGPGLGQDEWAQDIFVEAMFLKTPLLVDADGLNLLARKPSRRDNWILTPHPGEAAALLTCKSEEIQADRLAAVQAIQKKYGGVCVLKGARTLICDGSDVTGLCAQGNPGMATGGMGDVLSGIIGGLLAQKMKLADAARLGVVLHAEAGDQAAQQGQRGLLAMDLMPHLRTLVG